VLGEATGLGTILWDAASGVQTIEPPTGQFFFGKAINNNGMVVGRLAAPADDFSRAAIWSSGTGVRSLHDLIENSSGWQLESAWGISNAGHIAGSGIRGVDSRAFLLTPIPEPDSLAALGLALALSLILRLRQSWPMRLFCAASRLISSVSAIAFRHGQGVSYEEQRFSSVGRASATIRQVRNPEAASSSGTVR
jgi:hypothetical protein